MMLSAKQMIELEKPFGLKEHGFLSGNPYIFKSALRVRLFHVDPDYTTGAPELIVHDGDVVVMRGSLTIGGVTHYGIGTGTIIRPVDEKTGELLPMKPFDLARSTAKAYKQAASDILPRAALEFNCGAYLKGIPKDVKQAGFEAWLKKLSAPVVGDTWTDTEADDFVARQLALGMTNADIFAALGVKHRSEWRRSVEAADQAMKDYVVKNTAKPATPKVTEPATQ